MKKLLQTFSKKKGAHRHSHHSESAQQISSNNDSQHSQLSGIACALSDNELDHGKLDDSMREVSQVLDSTCDISGKHLERDNKAYHYNQVASNVVHRLSAFTNLVQSIADVGFSIAHKMAHPYSKMAWAIISGVVNVVTYTQDVDQNILELFETLDATYKFIEDTKEIENYPSYKCILSTLAKQTVDCAYFIRDYAKIANFWARVGKNVIGGPIKARVQTYQTAFSRLLAEFGTHLSLHTELAVSRVLEWNQEICEVLYLDSLPYAMGAGLNTRKQCLLGTRIEVLNEIFSWINDGDESCPKLFWLAGPAGVGKSAIAHSTAIQFESIGRLGSFFCFDRNYSLEQRRDKIFSTIARDLADLDDRIKHELAKVIRNKTSLRTTTDLNLQWRNFIFEPLNAISEVSTGPILIIVDALDECGNPSSRQDLLKVLETEITSLPANVRFLITSRLENDIMLTLNKLQPHIRVKMMDTIQESELKRDILTYFKANLHFFGDAQLMHLVGLSQGLFQWAYLALQFLNGLGKSAGLTVTERYEDLVRTQHIRSIDDPLDAMYTQILSSLFDTDDSRVMARFRSIIGNIITSFEPLSLNTLVALHSDRAPSSQKGGNIKIVIQYMGSLLSGIDDPSSTIRPLHLSFREYLLDPNRSHEFSIDSSPCHYDFGIHCIRTRMEELRFNICDFPDSHKRNSEYENLSKQVSSSISIPLSYSCRFWALHVSQTGFDSSLARKVEEFLYHKFLLWLEVLSLVNAVNIAAKLMSRLISWSLAGGKSCEALYNFAVDGKRFVRLFGDAIALSAPHIYLSALPFCPRDSIIYKTYIGQFPNTLKIVSEPICNWPFASTGSDVGYLDCISFSHGGEYLAVSLLEQGIFKLLDSETFDILWIKEVPDNEVIHAIQFSSGDRTFVFTTETKVYLFDILTGSLTLHWDFQLTYGFRGETESEGEPDPSYIARFSQNAKYIALIYKSSLIVWNLETAEETINIPLNEGHVTFNFSNIDSDHFITYSMTIGAQVWDLETGTLLHGPFQPPQNAITYSTTVSQNEKDIFSFNGNQLHKWDFRDGSLMTFSAESQPIVYRVSISPSGDCCEIDIHNFRSAFSKDGKYLASCDRGHLNIWELEGWQTTPNIQQYKLPTDRQYICSVSSDGDYLLMETVLATQKYYHEIWDVELERSIRKLNVFKRMAQPIFSPQSRYLAYISENMKILTIYDIHFGITKELLFNDENACMDGFAFTQDETCIATLDLSRVRIHIWDVTSCQILDTLTIPAKPGTVGRRWKFKASSNLQYFAYCFDENENNFSLVSRMRSIPVDSLIRERVHNWCPYDEDFSFGLDEEFMLVSCGLTILNINLITEEHRAIALLRGNHMGNLWKRRIHFGSSSDAVLVEIRPYNGYNIWNAFSGQLLYSTRLDYPDIWIERLHTRPSILSYPYKLVLLHFDTECQKE
ncbi:hypothetical protein Clacol_003945 [Clathrus columnatus]|uniref:Nephrocystin 3-like N-terminal domain-containing protein n=1 Tax=Clathrus columnatus TaxID=1419009 RepID=A0AAV5A506_9AGAM|nr:hypothetical protein Clacol_003945 [Clathrus columnatus]